MKPPHILLASGNVRRLKTNLAHVIDAKAADAIEAEISRNVVLLFKLGEEHYSFGRQQGNQDWRQKISRLYYGAYNIGRAVRLWVNGEYSTEITDHKKIEEIPVDFPNRSTYGNRLGILRTDRNLCDYDHTAGRDDLLVPLDEASQLVGDFVRDARAYLRDRGVNL